MNFSFIMLVFCSFSQQNNELTLENLAVKNTNLTLQEKIVKLKAALKTKDEIITMQSSEIFDLEEALGDKFESEQTVNCIKVALDEIDRARETLSTVLSKQEKITTTHQIQIKDKYLRKQSEVENRQKLFEQIIENLKTYVKSFNTSDDQFNEDLLAKVYSSLTKLKIMTKELDVENTCLKNFIKTQENLIGTIKLEKDESIRNKDHIISDLKKSFFEEVRIKQEFKEEINDLMRNLM